MASVTVRGDLKKTEGFLQYLINRRYLKILDKYGKKGVEALAGATPKKSGKTAASWGYRIEETDGYTAIVFENSNVVNDWCNIAIILQTGHGTRNGGYVRGRDYINPAIQPIFDDIATASWKEVTRS